MKYAPFFVLMLIAGCASPYPQYEANQKLRREIFQECMKSLPAGPKSTVYNDWDEVVNSCESAAYFQSMTCVKNCKLDPSLAPTLQIKASAK